MDESSLSSAKKEALEFFPKRRGVKAIGLISPFFRRSKPGLLEDTKSGRRDALARGLLEITSESGRLRMLLARSLAARIQLPLAGRQAPEGDRDSESPRRFVALEGGLPDLVSMVSSMRGDEPR